MHPLILQYGINSVVFAEGYFRDSALTKGRKLCTANYVYGVEETVCGSNLPSEIAAKCHSQVKQASYDVKVQLNEIALPRTLVESSSLFFFLLALSSALFSLGYVQVLMDSSKPLTV
ncbi:hypothetical protein HPB50_023978 [Hyalomma asiaticum]|uniref:Uncharacterized protein n=1 Tax=Hyalomma asiaticum TaxID=266040 RepID=A0ACB7S604_HYAAI|nr:hypothetical protein HPB50_023978 [Hyalomma asiaticum]